MGVDSFFHPKIGGGVPSFMPFQYSTGIYFVPAFILSGRQFSVHRGKFSAKQGKSEFFFGVLWCFLGNFGDNKVQNLNIFLKYGVSVCGRVLLWWWCFIVSTGPEVGRLSRLQDLPEVGSGPIVVRSMHFVRFTALCLSCRLRIWLYFAF